MALISRPLIVDGAHLGMIFTLEKSGDVFPVHSHTEADNHITIVAHGSVRVMGAHEGVILEAKPGGTIIDWVAGEPHGFVALTDGATLVNIVKSRP
jgi:quercetin dioxygenase-like cupin family protein